ncbi:MAG TPA: carboxylase, partial [bacterium]|nr:carboxylase [bacterium]
IEGFNRNAVKSGIDIMRIFDALNDLDNMKSTIKYVKENGGLADCCVCYTVDPKFTFRDKVNAFMKGKKLPSNLFSVDYFVKKSVELEKMGADMISIKDMAGLIDPETSSKLISALKKNVSIPVDLHTHCTPGYGLGSVLMAIVKGVDIVDTVIMPFAGGPAAPSFELVRIFADKLGLDTGVDLAAVKEIRKELFDIRHELCSYDQYKMFPKDFDPAVDKLPPEIDRLFDDAITAAKADDTKKVTELTQAIEKYFNFPEPDEIVRVAQIPGGMYTNMLSQLQAAKLGHQLQKVLATVPMVRLDAGVPPLVTPTSQIVGIQAVSSVINKESGKAFYDNTSVQFVNLVKGVYGKTPWPVDPDFREKVAGHREERPYDTSKHVREKNDILNEFGGVQLAATEKEALLLELFPAVARGFLKKKREAEYKIELMKIQDELDKKRGALVTALEENFLQ